MQTLKLAYRGDAIAALSFCSQVLDVLKDMRVVSTVQQFGCLIIGDIRRKPSLASALSIGVDAFDYVSGKSHLAVGQGPPVFFFDLLLGSCHVALVVLWIQVISKGLPLQLPYIDTFSREK
jgi:hypothetical protein